MVKARSSSEIYINETQRRPNLYASNVLAGVVAVMFIICVVNEVGVFQVNKTLVRVSLLIAILLFLSMQFVIHKTCWIERPACNYFFMSLVLFLVLAVSVLMNIHAVLAFVLPILLATQYRSRGISRMALIGSCLCCFIAPILSYLLDTWSLLFMTGYVQTFCHVTVDATAGNDMSTFDAIWQIMLYWSLPQALTLGAFGIILFSTTRSGIDSVNSQMQVADLSNDLDRQMESIMLMQEKVLYSMSDIIENRDIETGGHVRRTSEIVRLLLDAMRKDPNCKISDEFYANVIKSAPMHDLGKIAVPDSILRKKGKLTADEYEIVKQHPIKSAEIIDHALTGIEDDALILTATNIAKYHHERMDGKGYPDGLQGGEIPLEARIMAIADVYDALVNERCYKAPLSFEAAFQTIEESMGSQFDPGLNRYFISCRPEIEKFYLE